MTNQINERRKRMSDLFLDEGIGSFYDRLESIIGEESVRKFASRIGVSEGTLRGYLKNREAKRPELIKMFVEAGCDPLWLMTGVTIKELAQNVDIDELARCAYTDKTLDESSISREHISPRLSQSDDDEYEFINGYNAQVSTGHGTTWEDMQVTRKLAFRKKWLSYRHLNPEQLRVVFAKGDSMEPTIHSGDSILVDTSIDSVKDGSIFVIALGGDLYAKRLQKRFDGGVDIISDNKDYMTQTVTAEELEQLQVIGKVVWVGKDITS